MTPAPQPEDRAEESNPTHCADCREGDSHRARIMAQNHRDAGNCFNPFPTMQNLLAYSECRLRFGATSKLVALAKHAIEGDVWPG